MLPIGIITLWFGSIGTIPDGWDLCDGNNGTPDLRDKFIVCAGLTYAVNATGGAVNHNHGFTGDGHQHQLAEGIGLGGGPNIKQITDSDVSTGTTDNGSSLPPYHALCYIMKT